jgi:hypothetical protein
MNDGIMYTWNVVINGSHGNGVMHSCARLETAEYLRDWCQAIEHDHYRNASVKLHEMGLEGSLIERMQNGLDKYSVVESEVIL